MKLLALIMALFSNPPEFDVVDNARSVVQPNFTWTGIVDTIDWQQTGEKPFTGDCKTFSAAIANQIRKAKRQPVINLVETELGESHMIVCLGDFCADNRYSLTMRKETLPYKFKMEIPL